MSQRQGRSCGCASCSAWRLFNGVHAGMHAVWVGASAGQPPATPLREELHMSRIRDPLRNHPGEHLLCPAEGPSLSITQLLCSTHTPTARGARVRGFMLIWNRHPWKSLMAPRVVFFPPSLCAFLLLFSLFSALCVF